MDAITAPIITQPAQFPVSLPVNAQPVINPAPTQAATTNQVALPSQPAQAQPVQPKVQYANPEVLGTEAVTTYMVNGQIYTRYRNEITNKVIYVPSEAQILPGSGSGNAAQPVLNITA